MYCILQIQLSDVDFVGVNKSPELLKIDEDDGVYPPRFLLSINCTPTARLSQTRVKITGAVKELVFDIPLNPLHPCIATGK